MMLKSALVFAKLKPKKELGLEFSCVTNYQGNNKIITASCFTPRSTVFLLPHGSTKFQHLLS